MTRVGLVACCNYRSRSSSPRQPHSQPDPVLNTVIELNVIKPDKKNIKNNNFGQTGRRGHTSFSFVLFSFLKDLSRSALS